MSNMPFPATTESSLAASFVSRRILKSSVEIVVAKTNSRIPCELFCWGVDPIALTAWRLVASGIFLCVGSSPRSPVNPALLPSSMPLAFGSLPCNHALWLPAMCIGRGMWFWHGIKWDFIVSVMIAKANSRVAEVVPADAAFNHCCIHIIQTFAPIGFEV